MSANERHKIRNFAEALYSEIEATGLAKMGGLEVVDTICGMNGNSISVFIAKSKRIGSVRKYVTQLLKGHYLEDLCDIEYK